ncbi:MAG: hypothetical protein JNK02_11025 [Planctomycetes bacterium]|nr:hypothetical protein [Planctomycetota bacterium]
MPTRSRWILPLGACLALLAPSAQADVLLTRKTRAEAYRTPEGEVPAKESTTTIWVGKDRLRMDDGERVVVVRLDQKQVHLLDPASKVASTLDLPVDLAKLAPPEVSRMLEGLVRGTTVTSATSAESQRVGAWNARRSVVRLGGTAEASITVWTTQELPLDPAAYAELVSHAMSVRPGGALVAEEMRKLGGISVLTEREQKTGGLVLRSRDELVAVETKDAPAGLYEIPAGFTVQAFDPLAEIMRSLPKRPPAGAAGGAPR